MSYEVIKKLYSKRKQIEKNKKKESDKNIYELKQRIEKEKSRKKYWDRKIQSWTTDFKEEREEAKLK